MLYWTLEEFPLLVVPKLAHKIDCNLASCDWLKIRFAPNVKMHQSCPKCIKYGFLRLVIMKQVYAIYYIVTYKTACVLQFYSTFKRCFFPNLLHNKQPFQIHQRRGIVYAMINGTKKKHLKKTCALNWKALPKNCNRGHKNGGQSTFSTGVCEFIEQTRRVII